jgi:prepilin-type N-terminal cleavage/methylation domain-containing protein
LLIILTKSTFTRLVFHSKSLSAKSRPQAFSLIEMLVVIALVGIMASIGLAMIGGGSRETIEQVRDQRNAQEVASLTTAAMAAGAPVVTPGDMRATIQNLMEGTSPQSGYFSGTTFRLGHLRDEEITGALKYLEWRGDQPVYTLTKK